MQKKYQMPFNPRALWHWAYFNNNNSAVSGALESMQVATKAHRAARWYEITGNSDRASANNTDDKIWFEQQRQYVRAVISKLPYHQRALGNVLYMPAGEIAERDLMQILNYLYKVCDARVSEQFPNMRANKRGHLAAFVYCAVCHYWDAVSPTLDGGPMRSMNADHKAVKEVMDKYQKPIITRRWQGEWKPLWDLIISEIKKVDNAALKPLDAHIEETIERWSMARHE